jgi:ribosomal protein S17
MIRILLAALAVAWLAAPAYAQKPVTKGAAISESFTIDAIDHSRRIVSLRDKDGVVEDVYCGPEVKRFDALKVGDKVTFRYYESVVYQVRKPGTAAESPSSTPAVVRTPGDRPGGTVSEQMTATVTITALDPKVPSVTVTSADGRKMSFKVENPKNIEGVKVGDKVEITYTQAIAISVQ